MFYYLLENFEKVNSKNRIMHVSVYREICSPQNVGNITETCEFISISFVPSKILEKYFISILYVCILLSINFFSYHLCFVTFLAETLRVKVYLLIGILFQFVFPHDSN